MITATKEIDIKDLVIHEGEIFTLEKAFIERVKVLGIREIEPLLVEDVKVMGKLEKYGFLALLRDLFYEFKKLGDTAILVDEGTCGICALSMPKTKYTGIRPIRTVLELRGNNSHEAIQLALLGREDEPLYFRTCYGYTNRDGVRVENLSKLGRYAEARKDELSGYR